MEMQFSLSALIISILTSFAGSWMFFRYQRGKENRLRQKIAELEHEEKLVEKLSKGNIELIRSGFRAISFALFLIFAAGAGLQVLNIWAMPKIIEYNIYLFSSAMWATAAAICLSYFRTLLHVSNLDDFRARIREKREGLKRRL